MIGQLLKARVSFTGEIIIQNVSNGSCIIKVVGLEVGSVLNVDPSGVEILEEPPRINEEIKKKYLKAGGALCPFCGSSDITAEPVESDGGEAWCDVTCKECEETWKDVYKLVDIIEVE
jgi:hypothetical protein